MPREMLTKETTDMDDQEANELIDKALDVLSARFRTPGKLLTDPAQVRNYLSLKVATREHEVFGVLLLDNQHRLIADEELFQGTIDGASVYPREVVKAALKSNAAAVLFYHNHPSGVAEPSPADRRITERLQSALSLVEVRVLDHMVIGHNQATSFVERGLLEKAETYAVNRKAQER